MPDTDPVAAYLAEAKRAADTGPIADPRPLVAALEAAHDLIATWDRQGKRLDADAAAFDAERVNPVTAEIYKARAAVYAVCAGKLEMALQAGLLGEGSRAGAAVTGTGPQPPSGPPPDRVAGTGEVP